MKLTDPISAAGGVVGGECKLSKKYKITAQQTEKKIFFPLFRKPLFKVEKRFFKSNTTTSIFDGVFVIWSLTKKNKIKKKRAKGKKNSELSVAKIEKVASI